MTNIDPDKREGTAVSFPVSGGDGHRKLDKSEDSYHHVDHSGARLLNKFGVLKGYPPHKGEERQKWDAFWDRIEANSKDEHDEAREPIDPNCG
jgi:hypothetical protein